MPQLEDFLDPQSEVTPCTDADVARVEELFGHPLPDDYVELLRHFGGYHDNLYRPTGGPVQFIHVNDAAEVEQELDYDAVAEVGIAVAGTSGWRWVLQRDEQGYRYIDMDLVGGELGSVRGPFVDVLAHIVATMDHVPAEPYGDPIEHDLEVPDDVTALLEVATFRPGADEHALSALEAQLGVELPADHRAFLARTDGYEGDLIAPPLTRGVWINMLSVAEILEVHREAADLREVWPTAVVVGGEQGTSPLLIDCATGTWFQPLSDGVSISRAWELGDSLASALVAKRSMFGE